MRNILCAMMCGIVLLGLSSVAGAQETYGSREKMLGMKSEGDVLYSAMWQAAQKVTGLPGLSSAKKVAIMIVREPAKSASGFDLSSKYSAGLNLNSINPLGWALEALFEPPQVVMDDRGETPVGENGYSHSPMFEDLIIKALVQAGKFEVIEASGYYRGPLPEIMLKDSTLKELLSNPKAAATIGKMLGVDTVIMGSVGVSQAKRIQRHSMFFDNQYYMANFTLNVRTIDVASNEITSADTYYGSDLVKTFRGFRITMAESVLLGILYYAYEKD